jgi:TolB-like protein/DNA-binding winged helix-turn-helix (wHTH) protein/Tfp pilus assembly protein PilF
MSRELSRLYEFDAFRLDPTERQLLHAGVPVPLTLKAFDTLVVLVERSGHLVEKDELMRLVWSESFVEEANLARCVHTLRKALGEQGNEQQYIETVPKCGYRFVAKVRTITNDVAEVAFVGKTESESQEGSDVNSNANGVGPGHRGGEPRQNEQQSDPEALLQPSTAPIPVPNLHRRVASVLSVLLAVAVAIAGYLYVTRSHQSVKDTRPINSVAVLPFANIGASAETEFLSDGISESLINSLSKLPGLKVIARSSSFRYRGKDSVPQDVARELGVGAIVTGRVSQHGEQLQINVELIDAREGTHVWGDQYNHSTADLLAAQAVLSGEIARQLRLKLTNTDQQQLTKRETANAEAYELVIRGRAQREKGSVENLKSGVEFFKRAIAIDPSYAGAYAELSIMYGLLSSSSILDPREYLPEAEKMARQALALDANLAEANYAMANAEMNKWNWEAAGDAFNRALELNPSLARARFRHAVYLSVMGQHDQAIAEIERARDLNPLSPRFKSYVATILVGARRYDEALRVIQNTLALDPNSGEALRNLGYAYFAKGMYAEAIPPYQKAIKLGFGGPHTEISLGAAYARAGERDKALAILKQLQTSRVYVSPCELAVLYAALDQREAAFISLERAFSERDMQLGSLGAEPGFDSLRSDSRFTNLMQRVGLPR